MDKKQFKYQITTTNNNNNNNNCDFDDKNISKQELNGHRNEMNRKDNDIENLPIKDENRKIFINNCNNGISQNEISNSNHISAQQQQPPCSPTQNNIVDELILHENNTQTAASAISSPPTATSSPPQQQQQQSLSSPTNSNSTDNLSYCSNDNNYIEELLLLQSTLSDEDDDNNCQSINSDDCIYAYRGGGGIDYDLNQLELNHMSRNNSNNIEEDETDFLEMDFDPDPPSEEQQQNPIEVYEQREFEKEILLNEQRLNLNNDIILINNDITNNIQQPQINSVGITISTVDEIKNHNIQQSNNDNNQLNDILLPSSNELIISKNNIHQQQDNNHQYKITGTKPKILIENKYINGNNNINSNIINSNISTTITTTTIPINNKLRKQQKSFEFDKKNLIKNSSDLLNEKSKNNNKLNLITIAAGDCNNKESGDDIICLDCLEKEFLEKTVGKIIDNNIECLKCNLKRINPIMYGSEGMGDSSVNNLHNNRQQQEKHKQELEQTKKQQQQDEQQQLQNGHNNQNLNNHQHHKSSLSFDFVNDLLTTKEFNNAIQRRASCDNINDNEMLLRMTNKESSTFSSIDVDLAIIIEALEKINITYDEQILNTYFNECTRDNFIDVCDFILYSSKNNCNYKKIIKLIKLATKDQLIIKFNYDEKSSSFEVVQVKVNDIIQCWLHNNDLTNLKKLNKRFFEMNILGKIINIIRQAQQRITKQPLKEYILIPQYYKSGYITITKKN